MATYDPSIIHQHAAALYAHAGAIVRSYMALFGFFGAIAGAVLGSFADKGSGTLAGGVVCLLIGVAIGKSVGEARAFRIKLEAQTALCQAAIEENTRHLLAQR